MSDKDAGDNIPMVESPGEKNLSEEEKQPGQVPSDDGPLYSNKDQSAKPIDLNDSEQFKKAVADMLERKSADQLVENFNGTKGLLEFLKVDPAVGLSDNRIEELRATYGKNELPMKDPVTFLEFLIEAFGDAIIQMLCVAAVISIIFGLTLPDPHSGEVKRETGWIEGVAICISVAVVTLMGSINNYQKAKKFEEMEREQSARSVGVLRNGVDIIVDSTEVVVGDILAVESGIMFTCDCLYVTGTNLKCNESAMTGEPDIIKKNAEHDPFFISGTLLEDGAGKLVVVAVGTDSVQGHLKEALDEEQADTPLQIHLAKLADDIGKIGFVFAGLLLVGLTLKEVILITTKDKTASATSFLRFIIVAITIIVVAIPEGLPLAVTISLAFSMKAMMRDNCLVRILSSCETMGAATAICSDKTGTLTQNRMTVVQGCMFDEEFVLDKYEIALRNSNVVTIDRNGDFKSSTGGLKNSAAMLDEFSFALALNTSAREEMIDGVKTWIGNKTEHGILGFVNVIARDYAAMRQSVPEAQQRQFPFNSAKKRMSTIVSGRALRSFSKGETVLDGMDEDWMSVFAKGASEIVLDSCDRYYAADGSIQPLNPEKRADFLNIIEAMANQGNRTIGIGATAVPIDTYGESGTLPEEEPEDLQFVFMGVLGIQDPIRPEVPGAVDSCESAGLRVRMVTGDNINTAIAIAKKCRIYKDPNWDIAMTGIDFRTKYENNKDELFEIIPRLRVLARSSPQDKHILVGMLQDLGEVVGVTGDGTNDAPALKLANVGFAMNTGTDIAKGAADMILLDDNFASVVNATMWGRAVNDNIRKFLQYQLSINLGGVVLTIIGSLASETSKEPFAPVQLLWLNLIMDTMAALALATEKPEHGSLTRPPVFKQAPLLSNKMRTFIGVHAIFQTALILILLFLGHKWFQTVEDPENCNYDFFNDYVTAYRNVSTSASSASASYSTESYLAESPMHAACNKVCEDEGGHLSAGSRYCQQGRIHSTIIFNTFIFLQAFNIFNARRLYSEFNLFNGLISRSTILCGVFWVIVVFQVFAVEVAGRFMNTTGLTWDLWLICVGLGFIEIPLGVLVRLIPVKDFVPEAVTTKQAKEATLRDRIAQDRKVQDEDTLLVKSDPVLRRKSSITKNPLMRKKSVS